MALGSSRRERPIPPRRCEPDGNLVLYWDGHPLWASNTAKHPGAVLAVQVTDGNLVVYQGHRPIWTSGTDRGGNAEYYLSLQDNGNATINSAGPQARSGRRTPPSAWGEQSSWPAPTRGGVLAGVVQRPIPARDAARRQPRPLLGRPPALGFTTRPSTPGPSWAMQADGGLSRLPGQHRPIWTSGTDRGGQGPSLPEPP